MNELNNMIKIFAYRGPNMEKIYALTHNLPDAVNVMNALIRSGYNDILIRDRVSNSKDDVGDVLIQYCNGDITMSGEYEEVIGQ